jgi:hypothetical protein
MIGRRPFKAWGRLSSLSLTRTGFRNDQLRGALRDPIPLSHQLNGSMVLILQAVFSQTRHPPLPVRHVQTQTPHLAPSALAALKRNERGPGTPGRPG